MKYIAMILFCAVLLCKPTPTGTSQAVTPPLSNKEKENAVLRKIVQDNQSQIADLLQQLPEKPVVKPKIVYIKVYEKPPKKKYAKDYIEVEQNKLELLVPDTICFIPDVKPDIKKPNFFKRLSIRLFHHKKPK